VIVLVRELTTAKSTWPQQQERFVLALRVGRE